VDHKIIKVKDLKPGDRFIGEESRTGYRLERIPCLETVESVVSCFDGRSTEYICISGRLYLGPNESSIRIWRSNEPQGRLHS
jgi:hypothetical protein